MEGQIPLPPMPDQPKKTSENPKKRKRVSTASSEKDSTLSSPLPSPLNHDLHDVSPKLKENKSRPSRNKQKQSCYVNQSLPPETQEHSGPVPKKIKISVKKQQPVRTSAAPTTIIVGAGIVGLFTALELAERSQNSSSPRQVTVIDINDGPCRLASSHCTGMINTFLQKDQWQPLLQVSTAKWKEMLDSKMFRNSTAYNKQNFEMAVDESEPKKPHMSWARKDARLTCAPNDKVMGQVDTQKLAEWLFKACTKLGVKFQFNVRPVGIERDMSHNMTGVRIRHHASKAHQADVLDCSVLVLAAGPFTPGLLSELFPERQLALESNAQIYQWIQIQHSGLSEKDTVAATLELPSDIFTGPAHILARDDVFQVSRLFSVVPEYSLSHTDATVARAGTSKALRYIAAETLSLPGIKFGDKKHLSGQGVSIIGTGNEQNPVIGQVPSKIVGGSKKNSTDASRAGVWLAYGFGNFGTTLAPGVGRLLGQLLVGDEPEMDLYDFAVTELEVPDPIDLERPAKAASKGKARALR